MPTPPCPACMPAACLPRLVWTTDSQCLEPPHGTHLWEGCTTPPTHTVGGRGGKRTHTRACHSPPSPPTSSIWLWAYVVKEPDDVVIAGRTTLAYLWRWASIAKRLYGQTLLARRRLSFAVPLAVAVDAAMAPPIKTPARSAQNKHVAFASPSPPVPSRHSLYSVNEPGRRLHCGRTGAMYGRANLGHGVAAATRETTRYVRRTPLLGHCAFLAGAGAKGICKIIFNLGDNLDAAYPARQNVIALKTRNTIVDIWLYRRDKGKRAYVSIFARAGKHRLVAVYRRCLLPLSSNALRRTCSRLWRRRRGVGVI